LPFFHSSDYPGDVYAQEGIKPMAEWNNTVPETPSKKPLILYASVIAAVILFTVCGIGGVAVFRLTRPSSFLDASFPAREMGESGAGVVVEVFSDFQCPYCGVFAKTAELRLREEYIKPGKVLFIYRNFPIVDQFVASGNESHQAALAALCAGDQNMFWGYHDLLFQNQAGENQGNFNTARLQAFAVQLNLDSLSFSQCLINQSHLDILNADIQRGKALRINGTPTFFVNGVVVAGSGLDFEWLFDAINRELEKAGGKEQ
jgi:predicted DsbA family dithiol-disulfide isomerase